MTSLLMIDLKFAAGKHETDARDKPSCTFHLPCVITKFTMTL